MLEILRPGVQTTVQDLGRQGLRHLGIAVSGALDRPALRLANRLVGNPEGAAGLEIVIGPVVIRFHRAGFLALTGADFDGTLDDAPVRSGWRQGVSAGQVLTLHGCRQGMRAYLAVDGGIDVPLVLGSRATDIKAGFGGHQGRALRAGDHLNQGEPVPLKGRIGCRLPVWSPALRSIPGPEYDEFSPESRDIFWNSEWAVSPQSNRMGYRLQGEPLIREAGDDLLSHGVLPGVVQVPPNGQPIVLLADAQTTGGYPRIAVVIEADLWKLAQARPGARLRFACCTEADAVQALQQSRDELDLFEREAYGHRSECGRG
ncbi:biotin-dependent carboxyltransferase family protein [Crenobacter cavernae]|uniref:Biotin-dependent carboxyltransferase family protein n=1 Tax=Crenobacter cavernae TaxID=2290923 RepID=A0ABY0FJB3_9NEIS|nr:biotin-dependent carboxyltransferase family protein [Crenobacter cavernae]RXZ45334.1 biotin-dependent carboxyltransferase family protein [Crenobacter cavernae]